MQNYSLVEITATEFSTFNEQVSLGSFLQTTQMADLMQADGWETTFLAVKSDKIVLAALLAAKKMTGGKHFEVQYGPVYQAEDAAAERFFYDALRAYVKKRGALELLVIPNVDYQRFDSTGTAISEGNEPFLSELKELNYQHLGLKTGYFRDEASWHYVKDLSDIADEKKLLKSYSKDGQYSVKKTQQFGISVRPLAYEELADFKKMTAVTSERKGYGDRELGHYQKLYQIFGDKAEFLVAEINFSDYARGLDKQIRDLKNKIADLQLEIVQTDSAKKKKLRDEAANQCNSLQKRLQAMIPFVDKYQKQQVKLAAALFIKGASETVYLASGSYEEFKALYAPFAIQHAIMSECVAQGIPSYNFYGIQGIFDGTDGVLRFKQNFAGYAVQKVGYFYYYPAPGKYKMIQGIKKLLGRK